MHILNATEPKI